MTNVEALKAVYTALGGDEEDVAAMTTSADVIAAIATVIPTATASELPEVSATDNGSVLCPAPPVNLQKLNIPLQLSCRGIFS